MRRGRRREREEKEDLPSLYILRRSSDRLPTGQDLKSEYSARAKSKASGSRSVRGTSSGRCSRSKRYGFFLLWFIFHSMSYLVEF